MDIVIGILQLPQKSSVQRRGCYTIVDKFIASFSTSFILQVNEWQNDWPTFFIRHRLQAQMDLIERDYGDRKARELWEELKVGRKC